MFSPEDSSDVKIAATYIRYSDYTHISSLIAASNTSHSGLRTLSLLITADYSAWEWYSPIITFIVVLLLPSALTFITLLIHRIRAARAAQRDRAPEDVVHNLPWQVWTGKGWEKHEGNRTNLDSPSTTSSALDTEGEITSSKPPPDDGDHAVSDASTSDHDKSSGQRPWFETQVECAICLCEFSKGDKVRVLPCHHIFHLDEVDEWLIRRKKLCPVCKADVTRPPHIPERSSPPIPVESQSETLLRLILPRTATERTPLLINNSERPL